MGKAPFHTSVIFLNAAVCTSKTTWHPMRVMLRFKDKVKLELGKLYNGDLPGDSPSVIPTLVAAVHRADTE